LQIIIFHLVFFYSSVLAQSIYVTSEVDTSKASIGDIITWEIKGKGSQQNKKLEFPELNLKGDSISIYSQRLIFDDELVIGRIIEIAFWDTGRFYTPSYYVNVLDPQGNVDQDIEIEKVAIDIVSVLTSLSDVKVRPVKGPVAVKVVIPYKEILLIILCLVIVSAIIWVLRKRIKYIYPKNSYSIIKSPIEIANDRLSALNKKGFSKQFYSELSHITREYIEYSTYIRTLEMTTEEIIGNRELFHCDDDSFSQWIGLLSKADLVKYAKQSIEPYEMDIDKDKVIDLINNFFPE
jgi:hypothetical protein